MNENEALTVTNAPTATNAVLAGWNILSEDVAALKEWNESGLISREYLQKTTGTFSNFDTPKIINLNDEIVKAVKEESKRFDDLQKGEFDKYMNYLDRL